MIAMLYVLALGTSLALAVVIALAVRFHMRIAKRVAGVRGSAPCQPRSDLPPEVLALCRRAGVDAGSAGAWAGFTQVADLRLARGGPFQRVRARQVTALGSTGLVWDAVLLPRWGLSVLPVMRVLDALDRTGGRLEARLFGAIPLAQASGPDITLGEAYRYLAELPWAPDAMLGNPQIRWRIPAAQQIEAALVLPQGTAAVTFTLDDAGDIAGVEARARPALDAQGKAVRYDWRGRFWGYRRIGPRRIPEWGEVGYVYPEGYEVYFRGQIEVLAVHG